MAIDTPARIAILGAGPIGLEAALYARYLGYDVDVYERGGVADHVRRWGHARMVTPFEMNRSPLGMAALKAQDNGWTPPAPNAWLTGNEYARQYLLPLAQSDLLADSIHEQIEVLAVARDGLLKSEGDEDSREDHDFQLLLRSTDPEEHGREHLARADVVIDATGTYGQPNWIGAAGLPALGEVSACQHFECGLPEVLKSEWDRYANRNVLLVGSGHQAAVNLIALAELASQAPDTWVTWIVRESADEMAAALEIVGDDPRLAERQRVARQVAALVADDRNHVTFYPGTVVESLVWHADLERFNVRLAGTHAGELEAQRIIANVGYRPAVGLLAELRVDLCESTDAARGVGAMLREHAGVDMLELPGVSGQDLAHSEPDLYILGAKSYGRDPRFSIAAGLQQIRELFARIGDRPELNLYATMAGLY